ncbi:MAG TPA: O-antigen ligase domain-containing protein [Devosia sp.]|nr:O-antigen ligase domain-containing protein [Devosia sp.]
MFAIAAGQPADVRFVFNFLPFLLAFPVYGVGRQLAGERDVAEMIAGLFLAGTLIAVCVGLFDVLVRGMYRSEGFYSGALVIARTGLVFGFLAAAGFFLSDGKRRYVFLSGPVLALVCIYLAGARGALLIVPFLSVLFLVFVVGAAPARQRMRLAVRLALMLIAGGLGVAVLIGGSRVSEAFTSVAHVLSGGAVDDAIRDRLDFYSTGWTLFMQAPWGGYGWAGIPRMAFTILDPDAYTAYSLDFFDFHNDFLNFAVAAGVPGVAALLGFFVAPILSALRSGNDRLRPVRLYGVLVIVITYVLAGLTDISLGFDRFTATYAFSVAVVLAVFRLPASPRS